MFRSQAAFSGFAVNDMVIAKDFYGKTLGLSFQDDTGGTKLRLPNNTEVWMYQKDDHQPASYTMLNFIVEDIDIALEELINLGVKFEHYPGLHQDQNGIMYGKTQNMGPNIAWFKDPAGNILSILEV